MLILHIVKQAQQQLLSKKVEIIWFDHDHLLHSCNQECPNIFNHSKVWVYHSEGNVWIE